MGAQEARAQLVTPDKASASAGEHHELVPGQVFTFQLRFDRAPEGYGAGTIYARFKKVGGRSSPSRFTGMDGEDFTAQTSSDLHDGQAIYMLSLRIDYSMSPGKRGLVAVSLGRSEQKTFLVPEEVSFDIRQLRPMVVHVEAAPSVEAGQRYIVEVTLDEYPSDINKQCELSLGVCLEQASPNGRRFDLDFQNISPNQLSYKFSHWFEPDFPSGSWQVEVLDSAHPVDFNTRFGCRYPQLEGDVQFPFKIEPARGLVSSLCVSTALRE